MNLIVKNDTMVTLVLLPGMDGSGNFFADFVSHLGKGIVTRVISYPKDRRLSYAELAALVEQGLPKDKPYFILAESFSGPIGISIATKRPAGLLGLVLCCTFARSPVPLLKHLSTGLPLLPTWSKLVWIASPLLLGRWASTSFVHSLEQQIRQISSGTLRSRITNVLKVDVTRELSEISVPILYLQATRDRVVLKTSAAHMINAQSKMEVVEIEGPHLLLQACAEQAAIVVKRFIDSICAALIRR